MTIQHGTWSAYTLGCRCKQCRNHTNQPGRNRISQLVENQDKYRARRNELQRESARTATRKNRPWEAWEDEIAGDYSRPILEIARELGRTISSVRNRRKIMGLREKWYASRVLDFGGGAQK